jgi:hypothetical protein
MLKKTTFWNGACGSTDTPFLCLEHASQLLSNRMREGGKPDSETWTTKAGFGGTLILVTSAPS